MPASHASPPSIQGRIAVIGAGIVGSCIALELQRAGATVTLIDRDAPGNGCSFGNSGALSPSSIAPLAMPGVLASLPAMLLNPESPLALRLAYLPRAAPWLARFVRSARPATVQRSAAALATLHHGAVQAHRALSIEIGVPELFLQRGHLHLYPDVQALAKDEGSWRLRREFGYAAERLDRSGILELEPHIGARYQCAMYLADHATILNPARYVQAVAKTFADRGGLVLRDEIHRLERTAGRSWRLAGSIAHAAFDRVVVAAGAWSRHLLDPLGVRIALESQRGYHVQFAAGPAPVSRTVVLTDRKIFVTPMETGLRVGGTVEIAGLQHPPNPRRAAILERIARASFKGLEGVASTRWMGHRPCMPNSVPLIGPAAQQPGLWLAVGHGHLGLTDSVNTALQLAGSMSSAA